MSLFKLILDILGDVFLVFLYPNQLYLFFESHCSSLMEPREADRGDDIQYSTG